MAVERSFLLDLEDPIYMDFLSSGSFRVRHVRSGLAEYGSTLLASASGLPLGKLPAVLALRRRVAQWYDFGPEYVDPPPRE